MARRPHEYGGPAKGRSPSQTRPLDPVPAELVTDPVTGESVRDDAGRVRVWSLDRDEWIWLPPIDAKEQVSSEHVAWTKPDGEGEA